MKEENEEWMKEEHEERKNELKNDLKVNSVPQRLKKEVYLWTQKIKRKKKHVPFGTFKYETM